MRIRQPGPLRPFHGLGQDLRYGLRGLLASRTTSAAVIVSLALGIAVTSSAFGLLHAVTFGTSHPASDPDRLVRVTVNRGCGWPGLQCWMSTTTPDDYQTLQASLPSLAQLSTRIDARVALRIGSRPLAVRASVVSVNYFDTLGVRPTLGRWFVADERNPSNADVAVVSYSLWQRAFAGNAAALGQFIEVAGRQVRIVGITPRELSVSRTGDVEIGGEYGTEIWLPSPLTPHVAPVATARHPNRVPREYSIFYQGRLKAGATLEHARADASVATARVKEAHGPTHADAWVQIDGGARYQPRQAAVMLGTFMLVPLMVLAIACVNGANLLLARGVERSRDIAVRLALGASRWRVIRHLLVEHLVLGSAAGAAAAVMTWWLLAAAEARIGLPVPFNVQTIAVIAAGSLLSTLACGLAPAVRAVSRRTPSLGTSRAGDVEPGRMRVRRLLVAVQVALSLSLMATAGQMVGALKGLFVRTGPLAADRVVMASFDLDLLKLPAAASQSFYADLLERARALPGVQNASLAHRSAVWSWGRGSGNSSIVVWRLDAPPKDGRSYVGGYVAGDLFGTLGVKLIEGRNFVPADATPLPTVAIVSRELAKALFDGPAVGRRIRVAAGGNHSASHEVQIVGVIDALGELDTRGNLPRSIYVATPLKNEPALTLYLRSQVQPDVIVPALRAAVAELDGRVPVAEVVTVERMLETRYFEERLMAELVTLLGAIALGLAMAGVYAVVSFMVTMRSRELGIRIALGAAPAAVVRLVLKQSLAFAVVGGAAGAVAAGVFGAVVRAEILHAPSIDARWFLFELAVLAAVMATASVIPARRALRLNPVDVLRTE